VFPLQCLSIPVLGLGLVGLGWVKLQGNANKSKTMDD